MSDNLRKVSAGTFTSLTTSFTTSLIIGLLSFSVLLCFVLFPSGISKSHPLPSPFFLAAILPPIFLQLYITILFFRLVYISSIM